MEIWLSTFHYRLTHRKKNAIFDIPLFLAGVLFLIARLKLHESQLWNVLVWTVVIFSSIITSLNYIQLLWETRSTIKGYIIIWKSLAIMLLGFISSLLLLSTMWDTIDMAKTRFELLSIIIFFLAAAARLMHCYLGGKANLMPDY